MRHTPNQAVRHWVFRAALLASLGLLVAQAEPVVQNPSAAAPPVSPRQNQLFDAGWQFHLGDVSGAQEPGMDSSAWRRLDLPHDWSVEGEFSPTNASCTGYLPGGIGWYRKSFPTEGSWLGQKVFITFDGVYRNSEVWLNGHSLGRRPYGYISFQYELTAFLSTNAPNVLAVRVERENVADSRWYPGSGIDRHVWLTVTSPVHVPLWGNYITTPRASTNAADVLVRTEVANQSAEAQSVRVVWHIEAPDGQPLAEGSQTEMIAPGAGHTFALWQKVSTPKLWSPDSPALYSLVSRVFVGDALLDETRTPFGIRTFYFDANQGFFLNGYPLKLKGVCLHHDAGALGAAVPEEVLARRLQLVKELGGNAIRCSHNPMAPELYELCDRLGLLVMDEAFDEWELGKRKWVEGRNVGSAARFGYSQEFQAWAERDCEDMVRRDRNHPCIILWSLGNEIDYPTDPYVLSETQTVEGFAQDPRQPQQTRLAVVAPKLIAAVKRHDATRPVTMALANIVSSDATGLAQMLDVVGYNYQQQDYLRDHQAFPGRVLYGSETGRGYQSWRPVADNAFVAGQFLWAGFDFLGEAGPWPNHGSRAGLFDTRGFKKTAAWQQQALWSEAPMVATTVIAAPAEGERSSRRERSQAHWTWPQDCGQLRVVVFSNCEKVELRLNGRLLGAEPVPEERAVSFLVDYQPGILEALGFRGGVVVATNTLASAGEPAALSLQVEPAVQPADGRGVAHVVVSVVDARGNVVPSADNPVTVAVEGAGRLLGVDNGDQDDPTPLSSPTRKPRGGQVLAIVQRGSGPGALTLKAACPGLQGAAIAVSTKE